MVKVINMKKLKYIFCDFLKRDNYFIQLINLTIVCLMPTNMRKVFRTLPDKNISLPLIKFTNYFSVN